MNARFEQPAPEKSASEAEETQAIERLAPPEGVAEEVKTAEQQEKVDFAAVRKALDLLEKDSEFNSFFKSYPDADKFDLAKGHQEFFARYEILQVKKETENKIAALYGEELQRLLNLPFSTEAGNALSEFLSQEARETPDNLKERLTQLSNYEKLKRRKEELEKEADKLGSEEEREKAIAQLKSQSEKQEKATEKARWYTGWRGQFNLKNWTTVGWPFRSKEETELRGQIWAGKKEWSLWIGAPSVFHEEFESRLSELQKRVHRLENLPAAREEYRLFFAEERVKFFAGLLGARNLFDVITQQVGERLTSLAYQGEVKKDLDKLEEARNYFEQLKNVEELGIDVFKKVKPEEFEINIVKKIDKVVATLLQEKLSGLKTGNKAMQKIEEAAKPEELSKKDKDKVVEVLRQEIKESGERIKELDKESGKLKSKKAAAKKPRKKAKTELPKQEQEEKDIEARLEKMNNEKLAELLAMLLEKKLVLTITGAKIEVEAGGQK